MKEALKDASHLYEVEYRTQHAARPGFRVQELRLSKTQKVPWHFHNHVADTFYVLDGDLRIFLQDPKEEVRLKPGETFTARAAPAPRDQRRRKTGLVPRAAGRRRIRLRSPRIRTLDDNGR